MRFRRNRPGGLVTRYPTSLRILAAAAIGGVVVLASAVGASADPSIEDKRAQAEAIIAEIRAIDEEVGAAAERFNGASYELGQLTAELAETREDLDRARRLYKVSQARVAQRLRDLYVNGSPDSTLEVLLGARSLDDVSTELDATQRIAAQDAEITRQAKALRERVAERETQLAEARENQAEIVEDLAAEKHAIEAKLAERQRLLASVKDEIARLEEVERRRQAELRREAQRELERQRQRLETQPAEPQDSGRSGGSPTYGASSGGGPELPVRTAPWVDSSQPPHDAAKAARVVEIAIQYLGVPYKWGGASPETGFDCSGLTMYVFAQVGVSLPHYAAAQYRLGAPLSKDQLLPADLVFFRNLGHMGMYIGGGNFIHAPHTGDVVKISPLSDPYYVANWVGARRVL